jgi:hypothetical protein
MRSVREGRRDTPRVGGVRMPGPIQSRVAAWFIATLSLVGLCTEGAVAQSAPQLLLAALGPKEIVAEPALAPTNRVPFGLAVANSLSEAQSPNYFGSFSDWCKTRSITNNAAFLSNGDSSVISNIPMSGPTALRLAPSISQGAEIGPAGMSSNAIGPVRRARFHVLSNFIAAYKSLRKSLDVRPLSYIQKYAALMRPTVVGIASTYNPYRCDRIGP